MNTPSLEDRIRRAFPEPSASDTEAGLAAVLERRARREGIRLPIEMAGSGTRWWWVVGSAAAAVAAIWLVIGGAIRRRHPGSGTGVSHMAASVLAPDQLYAEASAHPSYPVAGTGGPELRPGQWTYLYVLDHPVPDDSLSYVIHRLDHAVYLGRPMWRFTRGVRVGQEPVTWSDTNWVDPVTMATLSRVEAHPNGTVTREYFDSSGSTSGSTLDTRRETFTPPWPVDTTRHSHFPALPISMPTFISALKRAPLGPEWRGSVPRAAEPLEPSVYWGWFDFRVVGQESISVPAGSFDCWKIRLGQTTGPTTDKAQYLWVSRKEQWVIQYGNRDQLGRYIRVVLAAAEEE